MHGVAAVAFILLTQKSCAVADGYEIAEWGVSRSHYSQVPQIREGLFGIALYSQYPPDFSNR